MCAPPVSVSSMPLHGRSPFPHLEEFMIRHVVFSLAAVGTLVGSTAVSQTPIEVTPYAGYMLFGDFVKGPLGTSLSNAGGALLGAQLGVGLTPNVAIVANAARASGDI